MTQKIIKTLAGTLAIALLFLGCSKKSGEEMDFGTLKNSVYENQYLGFSVTFPTDWHPQDQKTQKRMMKKGAKLLAADNDELNRAIKASELQTVNLFFVSKYLMGAPVSFNPNIVSIAESTEEFPGIERGKDYLFHAKELLETSSMQVHFAKGYSTEKVGGQDFDVLEARLTAMGKSIKQKYYARIIKGYALNFILTYTTDDELAGLQEVLNTVKFKQPN